MDYDGLVKYAEAMVNIANKNYIKGNKYAYMPLLAGVEPMIIESFRGAGHNCRAVVDAVHNRYAVTNDEILKKGYEEGFLYMIQMAGTILILDRVFNTLFHQLKLEKEGTAQFSIDISNIINLLNQKISENWEKYNKDNKNFEDWFKRYQQYALEKFEINIKRITL